MNQTAIKFIKIGSVLMALSVALGAFGAHALKNVLDEHMHAVYNTAVEYQFYHALGLLIVGFVANFNPAKKVNFAGNLMFISAIIFSGSLYIMTTSGLKWLGAITPIGGTGFIIAWLILFYSFKDIKADKID